MMPKLFSTTRHACKRQANALLTTPRVTSSKRNFAIAKAEKLAMFGGSPIGKQEELTAWPIVPVSETMGLMEWVLKSGVYGSSESYTAPAMNIFQTELCDYLGTDHALMSTSGTSALDLALAALDVGPGDEVIVPCFSWISSALCIVGRGAAPIFVDVDESGQIDLDKIPAACGPRTKAAIVVHLHGNPIDLGKLAEVLPAGVSLIEDACQAHGAKWKGQMIGGASATKGGRVIAAFSLQQSKNLPAGEGGVMVTNDADIAVKAEQARSFGLKQVKCHEGSPEANMSHFYGNMNRGNELAAAFAIPQLRSLESRVVEANKNFEILREVVKDMPGLRIVGAVSKEDQAQGTRSALHKVRLAFDMEKAGLGKVEDTRPFRNKFMDAMNAEGVEVAFWEQVPLNDHPLFSCAAKKQGSEGYPIWAEPDPARYAANVKESFPVARKMLDSSFVLFSQKKPFIAQTTEAVTSMARAIEKVWPHREDILKASQA